MTIVYRLRLALGVAAFLGCGAYLVIESFTHGFLG